MSKPVKYFILTISCLGLIAVYLFQGYIQEFFNSLDISKYASFIGARGTRYLLNDFFMLWIIYSLFEKRKYVKFALYVQLSGFLFVLIPYFTIKYFTNYNGPLLSFIHRLIVNPLLLMALIPALWYNQTKEVE